MFVPFVFTLDTSGNTENYMFWMQFYMYADACIKNKWPIIAHERYFEQFCQAKDTVFGMSLCSLGVYLSFYEMNGVPADCDMLSLKAYPVTKAREEALIAKYQSVFDCWADLLKNENPEFERIIGELLDRITTDFGEKPEGVLTYEVFPKALLSAAHKRDIPVIYQIGGVLRPPFTPSLNAFSLINDDSTVCVYKRYNRFLSETINVPILPRKGLLRVFVSWFYQNAIHNIDDSPQYEAGVLLNSWLGAVNAVSPGHKSDEELRRIVRDKYNKVLIRARPGCEPAADALDDSPTCFHFCCKCKRVIGSFTKGMFEAMLAGRAAHEYGPFMFHSFCNDGLEDSSKGVAPIEFLNFVLFGMCTPFKWLTDPEYLRFLLSNPPEREIYMRSFEHYTNDISRRDLEFYYMTETKAYRLGDILYFASGHKPHEYALYYCVGGLSDTCDEGGGGIWSNGYSTSFEFDLTEHIDEPLVIMVGLRDLATDRTSPNPEQVVSLYVNDSDCGRTVLTPARKYMRFTIPAECFTDKLQATFKYGYIQPDGNREIAVAFEWMYIGALSKDSLFAAVSDTVAELDKQIEGLNAQVERLNAQVNGLDTQAKELNAQVEGQKTHIVGLNAQVEGQKTHIEELNTQIKQIYNSRSWRLGHGIIKTANKVLRRRK